MSKAKLRFITIFALALLCVFTLGLAIAALPLTAYAKDKVHPNDIFVGRSGAEVGVSAAVGEGEDAKTYAQFTLNKGGVVEYNRSLALKWFVKDEDASGSSLANPGKPMYFSATFSFGEIKFESFDITFESAQQNVTKDGQTTNVLHFAYKDSALTLAVRDDDFEEDDEDAAAAEVTHTIADPAADLKFELKDIEGQPGDFDVFLTESTGDATKVGTFTNIGGYYLELRSSSSSSPQLPMAFEATMPENAAEDTTQTLLFKELNGQSFELNNGEVVDNAPAVLVINEDLYSFRLGKQFNIKSTNIQALDVCDSSVGITREYYMLEYAKAEDLDEGVEEKAFYSPTEDKYKSLTQSSTFLIPTDGCVLEPDPLNEGEERAYVSIRFKLDDETDANDTTIYLTWYADLREDANAVVTKSNETTQHVYQCPQCKRIISVGKFNELSKEKEEKGTDTNCTGSYEDNGETKSCDKKVSEYTLVTDYDNKFDYFIVDRTSEGPHYIGLNRNDETKTNDPTEAFQAAVEKYQEDVTAAAKDVSAGDGAYFYLPSLETLIGSDSADYRNLTFNIYYYKPSMAVGSTPSSATSLQYSNLRFEVDEGGMKPYKFRVIAQDSAGNAMKYYDEDGELVTVTASNVFDIEGIPEFTFELGYTGPKVEKPGSQSTAYNKQNYTVSDFDIVALEGYTKEYKLFFFEDAKAGQTSYSVEDLVKIFDEITDKKTKNDIFATSEKDTVVEGAKFGDLAARLTEIRKYDHDVTEDDDKWKDTDNDYAWDPDSSLSFTPQAVGIYVVEVAVTNSDGFYPGYSTHAYKVIEVTIESDVIYSASNWIENNTTAIILFAISAVLLVAIILLLVIKPNEKNLEEVDLSTLKGADKGEKTAKSKKKKSNK